MPTNNSVIPKPSARPTRSRSSTILLTSINTKRLGNLYVKISPPFLTFLSGFATCQMRIALLTMWDWYSILGIPGVVINGMVDSEPKVPTRNSATHVDVI